MPVKKILIVDDSATERQLMLELLSGNGFQCLTAENGEEAVVKSKSEAPDLILMDVIMPGMNGYQATRIITRDEATRHIPVIMLSSKTQQTDMVWGIRQGATAYLTKPVNPPDLLARISALP